MRTLHGTLPLHNILLRCKASLCKLHDVCSILELASANRVLILQRCEAEKKHKLENACSMSKPNTSIAWYVQHTGAKICASYGAGSILQFSLVNHMVFAAV